MAASSRTRSLEGRRDSQTVAGFQERRSVILPSGLVEVDCEEETGLIEQQWVHASDERLSFGIPSRQVPADNVVGDRQEAPVRALRTLDPRLFADALYPFVRACGSVPGSPGLAALESSRIDVFATAKE